MPTLNARYNRLLLSWARQGYPSPAACEECGTSLEGQKVYEAPEVEGLYDAVGAWLCHSCAGEPVECECGAQVASVAWDYHNCYVTAGMAHEAEQIENMYR